jgi:transposase
MDGIIPRLRFSEKEKLGQHLRQCRQADLKIRYLILINLLNDRSPTLTAQILNVSRSTVYRVVGRFRECGEWGLMDRREDNGGLKLDERYLSILYNIVRSCPEDYRWNRPTWTREMLVETMKHETGISIHVSTMSRALARIHARRGRPRPVVGCPWSKQAKTRRLNKIHHLIAHLSKGDIVVYEDEVDIDLNPKIGWDWMVRGQQKTVLTPGQNVKRYLAGTLDAATGQMVFVEGERKNSGLFISLLEKVIRVHPKAKVIHVILDNYRIHSSRMVQLAVRGFSGKVVLHFLPPYCPNDNRIERVWEDLHANVTRNHRCSSIKVLMDQVRHWLKRRNRTMMQSYRKKAA